MPLAFIQDELAFDSTEHVITFLMKHGATFYQNPNAADEQKILNCRAAQAPLVQAFEEKYRKATIKGAI